MQNQIAQQASYLNPAKQLAQHIIDGSITLCELDHFKFVDGKLESCFYEEAELTNINDCSSDDYESLTHDQWLKLKLSLVPTAEINFYRMMYSTISHQDVAKAFIAGEVNFWKRNGDVWSKCDENSCEWISLIEKKDNLRALPHGYPKEFVFMVLMQLEDKFKGLTPDQCATVEDFMEFYQPGITEVSILTNHNDCVDESSRTIIYKGDRYSITHSAVSDEESSTCHTEWKKNGNLHRLSGPAFVKLYDPYIDSEGHLASDIKACYVEGQLLQYTDDTYENIESRWSCQKQSYFGINQ